MAENQPQHAFLQVLEQWQNRTLCEVPAPLRPAQYGHGPFQPRRSSAGERGHSPLQAGRLRLGGASCSGEAEHRLPAGQSRGLGLAPVLPGMGTWVSYLNFLNLGFLIYQKRIIQLISEDEQRMIKRIK